MTMTKMEIMSETRRVIRENIDEFPMLEGITIKFDRATARVGQYHYVKRQVSYSEAIMAHLPREDILDTITHEIAHAIAGRGTGHSILWKRAHQRLGGSGLRAYKTIPLEALISISKYRVECAVTGEAISSFDRMPKRQYFCKCHKKNVVIIQQR
mgnify:CR=1 FL=1